jgi:peptidoglycan/xylan/chitin deacetylase (PgdA/CDA1 family)
MFFLYHLYKNKNTLTIVMFHRIMPEQQANDDGADPLWTIRPEIFKQCLVFFQKYYNVISIHQLKQYIESNKPLPPHALLISLDDGWRDNYVHGFPLLKMYGLPSVLFVVGNSMGNQEPFWQEQIVAAGKKGALDEDTIDRWLAHLEKDMNEVMTYDQKIKYLIRILSQLDPLSITQFLEIYLKDFHWSNRQMLSADEISEMYRGRVDVGAHGYTHRPMAILTPDELTAEFQNLDNAFCFLTGRSGYKLDAMSFPHGSYSAQVVKYARDHGFNYLFSSDPVINIISEERKTLRIWGRIVIDERSICKSGRKFCQVKMSRLMMFRPKRIITDAEARP